MRIFIVLLLICIQVEAGKRTQNRSDALAAGVSKDKVQAGAVDHLTQEEAQHLKKEQHPEAFMGRPAESRKRAIEKAKRPEERQKRLDAVGRLVNNEKRAFYARLMAEGKKAEALKYLQSGRQKQIAILGR